MHIGDGFKFMEEHQGSFDVIITDSSDPIGTETKLFTCYRLRIVFFFF